MEYSTGQVLEESFTEPATQSLCHWPCTCCINVHCRRLTSRPWVQQNLCQPKGSCRKWNPKCYQDALQICRLYLTGTQQLPKSAWKNSDRKHFNIAWRKGGKGGEGENDLHHETSIVNGGTITHKPDCKLSPKKDDATIPTSRCTKWPRQLGFTLAHNQRQGNCYHVPSSDQAIAFCSERDFCRTIRNLLPGHGCRRPVPPAGRCGRAPCFSLFLRSCATQR